MEGFLRDPEELKGEKGHVCKRRGSPTSRVQRDSVRCQGDIISANLLLLTS